VPSFRARLFRYPGPGGWHFVTVPAKHAPPPTEAWGRRPVHATVDEWAWDTSVWWDTKTRSTLLAVPKKARGAKGDGDTVTVTIEFRES
jgi:hypothetical protein